MRGRGAPCRNLFVTVIAHMKVERRYFFVFFLSCSGSARRFDRDDMMVGCRDVAGQRMGRIGALGRIEVGRWRDARESLCKQLHSRQNGQVVCHLVSPILP